MKVKVKDGEIIIPKKTYIVLSKAAGSLEGKTKAEILLLISQLTKP